MSSHPLAVIVVDAQESYRHRPYFRTEAIEACFERHLALVAGAVSGIRAEPCRETATRRVSDLGYGVDFVREAALTFPMKDRAGREWKVVEIRERTELVLDDRFAKIKTVEDVFAAAER